jgi:hypothetical protein
MKLEDRSRHQETRYTDTFCGFEKSSRFFFGVKPETRRFKYQNTFIGTLRGSPALSGHEAIVGHQ